jgi:hypothetical protein
LYFRDELMEWRKLFVQEYFAADQLPEDAVTSLDELQDMRLDVHLSKGQIVRRSHFQKDEAKSGFQRMQKGEVGVILYPANDTLFRPGMRVDVLFVYPAPDIPLHYRYIVLSRDKEVLAFSMFEVPCTSPSDLFCQGTRILTPVVLRVSLHERLRLEYFHFQKHPFLPRGVIFLRAHDSTTDSCEERDESEVQLRRFLFCQALFPWL